MKIELAYAAAIVGFSVMSCGLIFAATGGRYYPPAAASAPASAPAPESERVCLDVQMDGTIQGACYRWGVAP